MHAALSMRRFSLPGIHEPLRDAKVLDVWRRDSDTRQLVDGEIDRLRSARQFQWRPGSRLVGAGVVVRAHSRLAVAREPLEGKSVIGAARQRRWRLGYR